MLDDTGFAACKAHNNGKVLCALTSYVTYNIAKLVWMTKYVGKISVWNSKQFWRKLQNS